MKRKLPKQMVTLVQDRMHKGGVHLDRSHKVDRRKTKENLRKELP